MPEPLLYWQAMAASAIVSSIFVWTIAGLRRGGTVSRRVTWLNSACVVGIGSGLAVGYYMLSLNLAWPPISCLDRFLLIIVPMALGVEWIAGFRPVPRAIAWLMRGTVAATVPRILLHGSTYLSGTDDWTPWQAAVAIAACGGLLLGVWSLLSWLAERSPGVSIAFALCLAIQCAGVTVMMAGYIKGGAAAIPLVAALMAVTIGSTLIAKRFPSQASGAASSCLLAPAILGIGVVGLFGVLFIGRFFGRLSTASALTMMLAPLLCWATETPLLRDRKPWLVGTTRLTLVTIPLLVVLFAAKRVFDREMSPLLGKAPVFQMDDAAFAPSTHSHRSLQDQSTGAFQDADAYGRMAGIFHKAAAD